MALLVPFSWDGGGLNDSWSNCSNWGTQASYPDDTGDDATFPDNSGTPWDVDLVTVTIGNLTIEESVDFGTDTDPATLSLDNTLTIDASGGAIVVTMGGDGEIRIVQIE